LATDTKLEGFAGAGLAEGSGAVAEGTAELVAAAVAEVAVVEAGGAGAGPSEQAVLDRGERASTATTSRRGGKKVVLVKVSPVSCGRLSPR